LAARIDHHVTVRWQSAGVEPVPPADDAEFLRRVSLDLLGRIPTAGEVRLFLADQSPDKRRRLVDDFLDSAAFARHWSTVLTSDWLPQASDPVSAGFQIWLEKQWRARVPYDRLVQEMLTAEPRLRSPSPTALGADAFLVANDFKPENLAASTARQFFGLNLDCAQCHNHPFARWTQDQFWEFAAFFADARPAAGHEPAALAMIAIPLAERTVTARFPDGVAPRWQAGDNPRAQLVQWMTASQTPYFARNAVNRLWAYFLGTGLVDPLDDLSGAAEPSHPELLDELSAAFAASGYDARLIIRGLLASRAYQLTSAVQDASVRDSRLFARMPLRPLSAEQRLASVLTAAGVATVGETEQREFLARFKQNDRRAEPESSVLQSLMRMNGALTTAATDAAQGGTLRAATTGPLGALADRIEVLYLSSLSRLPTADEQTLMQQHVAARGDTEQGLANVFWVLINSAEFGVNH